MMKVTVIAMSSLKEKYLKDAAAEHIKRLKAYCDITVTEIEPERLPDRPSKAEADAALEREAVQIIKRIPPSAAVVPLCIEGKELSSEQLAEYIDKNQSSGRPLVFIIGSSYGLSEKVKRLSDIRLSFSKLTFPHQLFRIMLLEQLYRAFRINGGGAYHK